METSGIMLWISFKEFNKVKTLLNRPRVRTKWIQCLKRLFFIIKYLGYQLKATRVIILPKSVSRFCTFLIKQNLELNKSFPVGEFLVEHRQVLFGYLLEAPARQRGRVVRDVLLDLPLQQFEVIVIGTPKAKISD